jgi:hypothetical protein
VGYELHITRAQDWVDSEDAPISPTEWERAARADGRLVDVATLGGDDPSGSAFVWRDELGPSLYWFEGQVQVKGVRSQQEIGEIAAFGAELDANLVGDDGEHYDETGSPVP